jgi:hypothetical protein
MFVSVTVSKMHEFPVAKIILTVLERNGSHPVCRQILASGAQGFQEKNGYVK